MAEDNQAVFEPGSGIGSGDWMPARIRWISDLRSKSIWQPPTNILLPYVTIPRLLKTDAIP